MPQLSNHAAAIFHSAVESVLPQNLIRERILLDNEKLCIADCTCDLDVFNNIYVIGFGKASAAMAVALEDKLGDRITGGALITKYGHGTNCRRIRILEAGHPVPDANTLLHTRQLLDIAGKAARNDLVICLISGGGSALFETLPGGIEMADLQAMNNLLLACGADITEMNAIRKHISEVKGGRLARAIHPAQCISLILSDIIGDPLDGIASGPTAPDLTTFAQAWEIILKYNLETKMPPAVRQHLQAGLSGKIPKSVKFEDPIWNRVQNIIIGNNAIAQEAAYQKAEALGFNVHPMTESMEGEARFVAQSIVADMEKFQNQRKYTDPPLCLLYGGETTVTLSGNGKGGRNQELALAALLHLNDFPGEFALLSAGTDGTDGPTDAAGALITSELLKKIQQEKFNPSSYLDNNDAYTFFQKVGGLFITGPTSTNVMDLVIIIMQ